MPIAFSGVPVAIRAFSGIPTAERAFPRDTSFDAHKETFAGTPSAIVGFSGQIRSFNPPPFIIG